MKKYSFLVLIISLLANTYAQEAAHITTSESIAGNKSRINIDAITDNENAIVVAIPTEDSKSKLKGPVGIVNNSVYCYVFTEDGSPMPEGIKFKIMYARKEDASNFLFQATIYNINGNIAYIDKESLNNNPNAQLFASMSTNPSGVMSVEDIAFKYDEDVKQWYVYQTDNSPIKKDLGMYIIVKSPTFLKTSLPVQKDISIQILNPVLSKEPLTSTVINDVDFPNWNFEKGLDGWTKEGNAFNNQPTYQDNIVTPRILSGMELNNGGVGGDYWKNLGYNIGRQGNNWIGTYESNPFNSGKAFQTQGDGPTGTLTTTEFNITTKNCYFLIGGGNDTQKLYVELQIKRDDNTWNSVAKITSFRNDEIMYRERIDISPYKGKMARISIVDNSNTNWGHINVDNFRFTNETLDGITLTDKTSGKTYEVDTDTPIWGIADTHAHPAHELGFGKLLITGKATTPLSTTYGNDLCTHNHGALGSVVVRKLFIIGADPHEARGWPDFIDFPRFNSKTHQQQHVEFLKRAWQGGMRLYCALAINNMYVPALAMGPGNDGTPFDDETVLIQQIEAIHQMVSQNKEWMEIALSPKDARKIILQGKMAVVLGIEADNLGNFKAASYNWIDKNAGALNNNSLVTLTDANADQFLEAKLTLYKDKGIRQITPIHYISGLFGGAALFRSELAVQQAAFNNDIKVKSGVDKKLPYSLYADFTQLTTFSNPPIVTQDAYFALIKSFGGGPTNLSTINNLGLTSIGNKLILKMMEKAFIIDGEHMGYETKENVFSVANAKNYPIISSHTDPAGLSMNWTGSPVEFKNNGGSKDNQILNQRNFGTTNIRNLASEFEMADEHFTKTKNSGGTVGVFMLPYFKNAYNGYLGSVANDCAGSSKTFAQMYLYSADKMDLKGVALATDRGMTDFIGPRFGPNSAYALKDEKLLSARINTRKEQRLAQRNGVKYDVSMLSYHPEFYENLEMKGGVLGILDEQVVTYLEEDVWKTLAAIEAGVVKNSLPISRDALHIGRIYNFFEGYFMSQLDNPAIKNADYLERAAMYCVKNNKNTSSLPGYDGWFDWDKEYITIMHNTILPVLQSWQSKYGNNQPLRRFKTGNRYWDYNTDGMAHYGLMPDFLQDLRNIGVSQPVIALLFKSAEDYIQMWEKTEKASGIATTPSSPLPVNQVPNPTKKTNLRLNQFINNNIN